VLTFELVVLLLFCFLLCALLPSAEVHGQQSLTDHNDVGLDIHEVAQEGVDPVGAAHGVVVRVRNAKPSDKSAQD